MVSYTPDRDRISRQRSIPSQHYPSSGDTVPDTELKTEYTVRAKNGINGHAMRNGFPLSSQTSASSMQTSGYRASPASSSETSDSLEIVGSNIKLLVETITRLANLGVEKSDIHVPRVVVCGDQSSGKSSLVEAITEIKLPRGTGTCTRCPHQITIADANRPWQCTVTLVMKNHLVSREDVEHRMELGYGPMKLKYGNWATMATAVEHEFAVVSDKDGLEDLLKRAQIAILNPSIDCQSFLEGPLPSIEQCEAEFSPNYISLAIQGPGLPTLSFYDLPGVIHTMPDERKDYLVGAVRDMTSEYVADESSLVLLACSMEGDIQNSTASGIVRSLKATHRCLGVLTKPDRFPQGDPIDIWRKCLSGTAYPLGYGYFITRQPAQYQLDNGMTHAQARYQEARFFDQGPLWAQELYAFRDCFGTKNLQNKLSIELAGQIVKKLPEIHHKLDVGLLKIEQELQTLPEPPANAFQEVMKCLSNFNNHAQTFLASDHTPHNFFNNRFKSLGRQFRTHLARGFQSAIRLDSQQDAKLAQKGKADAQKSPSKRKNDQEVVTLDDDDDGTPTPVPTHAPKRKRTTNGASQAIATPSTPTRQAVNRHSTPQSGRSMVMTEPQSLDYVQEVIEGYADPAAPDMASSAAVVHFIRSGMKGWNVPMLRLHELVKKDLINGLGDALMGAFASWQDTELFNVTQKLYNTFLDERFAYNLHFAERALRYEEQSNPSTLNLESLEMHRESVHKKLKDQRFERRARIYFEALFGDKLADEDLKRKLDTDEKKIRAVVDPDPTERQVNVVARAQAYQEISSFRFADEVVRSLEVDCIVWLRDNLHTELQDKLINVEGVRPQDRCAQLLAQEPEKERRRCELKAQQKRFQEGKRQLEELNGKFKVKTPRVAETEWEDF